MCETREEVASTITEAVNSWTTTESRIEMCGKLARWFKICCGARRKEGI